MCVSEKGLSDLGTYDASCGFIGLYFKQEQFREKVAARWTLSARRRWY